MIAVFKVVSTIISDFGQSKGVRVIKGIVMGKLDVKELKQTAPFGIDSNPTNDKRGIFVSTTTLGKYYSVGVINTNCKAEVGETRIFSTDINGNFKTEIRVRNTGVIEIGGDQNNAVKYNELKSDLDALKATVNANATTFNAHVHILTLTAGTGTAAPSVTQSQSNSTDFSNIKNAKIKTND